MLPKSDHNMFDDIWKESTFAGAVFDVGVEEGREQGMRALAEATLERHFGPLTDELRASLRTADVATLVDILASATTLDDVKARLGIS